MPCGQRRDSARVCSSPQHTRTRALARGRRRRTSHIKDTPVVSAREAAKFAHELAQLLTLRVILVFFADLDPRALLEEAVAGVDALLNDMAVELPDAATFSDRIAREASS